MKSGNISLKNSVKMDIYIASLEDSLNQNIVYPELNKATTMVLSEFILLILYL